MLEVMLSSVFELLNANMNGLIQFTTKNLFPPTPLSDGNISREDFSLFETLTNDDLMTFLYMKWVFNLTFIILVLLTVSYLTYGLYKLTALPYNRVKLLGSIG